LITILFAAIYKVLPDRCIEWRDVLVGAIATSLLFAIGKFLMGSTSVAALPHRAMLPQVA
jgi:membrane protein